VNFELNKVCDPVSREPSRRFFAPSVPPGFEHLAFFKTNSGLPLDLDKALSDRSAPREQKVYPKACVKLSVSSHEAVRVLRSRCRAFAKLLQRAEDGLNLTHRERLRLAQIGIDLGLSTEQLVDLFRPQTDFCPRVSVAQIQSLLRGHRVPACKNIARDLGFCDGYCPERRSVTGAWSPIELVGRVGAEHEIR
jgi:hypothetical protein